MWMPDSERDERIDAIIDAAAQSLTAAEPSAALRAAVHDRVRMASAFRRKVGWWLVPLGATAALIAVMLVGRTLSDPASGPAGGPDKARPTDVPGVARPTDVRATIDNNPSTQPVLVARPTPVLALAPTFEEPEPTIPPLSIPPLETKLIAVETSSGMVSIDVEPMRIEPLQGE